MFGTYHKSLLIIGFVSCLTSSVFAYSGGSGEPNDPYQIAAVSDWQQLMNTPSDCNKNFIMTADVNLQGVALTPVGNSTNNFTGVFDGDSHIIRNAKINMPGNGYIGLFGYVGPGGQIRNLGVEDVDITGYYCVGGLAGGNHDGSISNCYSTGAVSGYYYAGGLVGENYKSSISNCYSTGNVTGGDNSQCLGGLVGYNSRSSITNCHSTGAVSGSYLVGGLVGENYDGSISNCYSTGNVTGGGNSQGLGGLVGENYKSSISNCYSTGTVSGSSDSFVVGGLVGENYYGSISNCYSTGAVSGYFAVGGLVGENYGGSISNCYSTGAVSGDSYVGGLVGLNYGGSISNCYSTSTVSGSSESFAVGGLVGLNLGLNYSGGSISNCYSTGAVSGSSNVGGLVGYNYDSSVVSSFWDVNTSGWSTSAGGTGKTTAQMQDINTFLNAGWDFAGETANGTEDIWFIRQAVDYPKFVWQDQLPTANAGPDQTVYAWIDDIAEVTLDGLDSNDPDGDEITYRWTWTIDANTYEVNGVSPIIELPIGVHTIQLVVSDGIVDSIPDDVNITVIAPLQSKLEIMPCVINRSSRQRYILTFIRMPEGIAKKDIDNNEPLILYPGEIEARWQWVIPWGGCRHRGRFVGIIAFFDKVAVLEAVPDNGRVELEVAGNLTSGQYFYGSDTVKIIGPRRPFHWPKK